MRQIAKNILFNLLGNPLVANCAAKLSRDAHGVLMANLHRVGPDDQSFFRALNRDAYFAFLDFAVRHFSIVSLHDLDKPTEKEKLILSWDDGYLDFVEHALPALVERNLPCNMNIIPSSVLSGRPPINVMMQDFLGKMNAAGRSVAGMPVYEGSARPDRTVSKQISRMIKFRPVAERDAIEAEFNSYFGRLGFDDFTPMMSLADLQSLPDLVHLGAHSWEHASMEYESDDYLAQDILRCRTFFHEKLGQRLDTYAFPNGSCTEKQVELCHGAGIQHVLTVQNGASSKSSPHSRFTFDASSGSSARYCVLGRGKGVCP